MDTAESKPRINSINIIRRPGWAETKYFKKDGIIMNKTIRPPWLKTELISSPRGGEDGGRMIEPAPSAPERKRTLPRNQKVGLWLDRNKAVIVSIANNIEARSIITSDMEHYVLYSTVVPGDGSPENNRDRRFWNHLDEYYDKILTRIRDAAEIQIFGPEVAKYELQKRLMDEGLASQIVSLEEEGKLTDHQIAAKVQKRFPRRSQFDIF
jgi:hypothetical protein